MIATLAQKIAGRRKAASSLFAAAGFGLSGAAFTLGMLLLARMLPVETYGRLTLAVALFNIFGLLTPLGVDQLFLRRPMQVGNALLAFLIVSGLLVGGAVAGVTWGLAGLTATEALLTALAIAGGGIVATTSVALRAAGRGRPAMLLAISASFVLLAAGLAQLLVGRHGSTLPLTIFAAGNALSGALGWRRLRRVPPAGDQAKAPIARGEALSLLVIAALGTLSLQIERIVIPTTLSLRELALFGVLAAVAIFPFRLLTAGVGFTLAPKLAATPSPERRRRIVLAELRTMGALMAVVTVGLAFLGPWAASVVTGGLYRIDTALILAGCANGAGKVILAFPRAMLTACGSASDLALLNGVGVAGLILTISGALGGARLGITGLLWGATLGGMLATLLSLFLAWRRLDDRHKGDMA